jgi:hypothetical protein
MLPNLHSTNNVIPQLDIIRKDVNNKNFFCVTFSASRLLSLFDKSKFRNFFRFSLSEQNNDYPKLIIAIYEYVGEHQSLLLEFFNNLQHIYPDKKICLIIDDVYEGLINKSDLDFIKQNLSIEEYAIVTSNHKLNDKKIFHLNYHLHDKYFDNIKTDDVYFEPNQKLRNKKFICLNRQERSHRLLTVDYLIEKDLVKHSHVSCQFQDFLYLTKGSHIWEKFGISGEDSIEKFYENRRYSSLQELKDTLFTDEQIERLLDNLPLFLQGETGESITPRDMPSAVEHFQDSYWALITERDFFKSDEYIGFTEKTVKCLLLGMPFIIIGLPYTLQLLQDLGFITFNKYIDESYDLIEDDAERFEAIKKQIDFLSSKNYNELHLMYHNMMPILQHNYERAREINCSMPNSRLLSLIQQWAKHS